MKKEKIKIILCGGGTAGSVTPLLAVARELSREMTEVDFLWLGTKKGPEKKLVDSDKIKFKSISSGKWRRYFSFKNILDIFLIIIGFFKACQIIYKYKPHAVLGAGSFVAVPVSWAAWFLGVPVLAHQQDARPGLANKLIAPVAKKITLTLPESQKDFDSKKTIITGNPVRQGILEGSKEKALEIFNLKKDLKTILILGGGTGALVINNLVKMALPELLEFCQVIHITGKGKTINFEDPAYHQYEFLTKEMPHALQAADLIITRAGMGTLTEISALGKPSIIIPLPGTHQEDNAEIFKKHDAAIIVSQKELRGGQLSREIKKLLFDEKKLKEISENSSKTIKKEAAASIVKEVLEII